MQDKDISSKETGCIIAGFDTGCEVVDRVLLVVAESSYSGS